MAASASLGEFQRLLGEPVAGGRIDDAAPLGVDGRARHASIARAVGLSRNLQPQVGVHQRPLVAVVGRGPTPRCGGLHQFWASG